MIRFFASANYDFIGLRRWALFFTGVFTIPGLLLLVVIGLDFSIEFTGGTLVQVETTAETSIGTIRQALVDGGLPNSLIQTFGSDAEYLIRVRLDERADGAAGTNGDTEAAAAAISAALTRALGDGAFTIVRTERVGPKVGGELREKAILAVLASFGAVLIYLAFRFEWRFGLAAVLATVHDIVASLAWVAYWRVEVSLVVVAAMLTIVGYSLNDTIVIFDRVRENLRKYKRENLFQILNRSINETLPRTVVTSGTTLAVLMTLVLFAGEVIRPFAWVMLFGILVGTFSSIFIASPVLLAVERRWPGQDARGARSLASKTQTT